MGNISTKINLRQLKNIRKTMKRKDGSEVECLIIPIEPNHLYKTEKGAYLDLIGFSFDNKIEDSKDTHLVKQSLPKEVFEKMTEEEKKAIPVIGNHIVWGFQEPEPQIADIEEGEVPDDLPF